MQVKISSFCNLFFACMQVSIRNWRVLWIKRFHNLQEACNVKNRSQGEHEYPVSLTYSYACQPTYQTACMLCNILPVQICTIDGFSDQIYKYTSVYLSHTHRCFFFDLFEPVHTRAQHSHFYTLISCWISYCPSFPAYL